MILKNLALTNFRSFEKISFSFSDKLTVIVGPNTSGKTNILEAIYLLATAKSFRAEQEKEIISYGEEITRIKGIIRKSSATSAFISYIGKQKVQIDQKSETTDLSGFRFEPTSADSAELSELELILTTGSVGGQPAPHKKYLVNGVPKRMVDFLGNLRAALFWPEDLELVTDSPSIRRKYLDLVLCQADREYARSLLAYEKGVRQRNKLLEKIRDEGSPRSQLTFWNQLLLKNGNVLTNKREEYVNFINGMNSPQPSLIRRKALLTKRGNQLPSPERRGQGEVIGNYQLIYDKSVISESRLEQYAQNEIGAAMTLVGPHRDDVKFEIRNSKLETPRDLSLYGSRGEQRMAVLWLKLGELEFMAKKTGGRPILLLDDIFSELDKEHRQIVLQIIPNQQTIMTTTDLHLIDQKFLKSAKIIEL